ncbi:ABC transporter permease [Paenibacillus sp. P46E]|uniref:ABC transporter permease n=1 Tax=Paenibacillus sp. P46E TaxID=1349436 RepID=UPI000A756051|nr:ABC transporter permease [Paenibacillus sp. P46E]
MFERVGPMEEVPSGIARQAPGYWKDIFGRLRKSKVGMACLFILLLLVSGAVLIPMLSQFSIADQDLTRTNLGLLTDGHIFGTDKLGRDVFVRVWYGTRISLTIAFSAVLIDLVVGLIYGGVSGYFGGKLDELMMRVLDVVVAIPYLIIVILLMIVLQPGVTTIIIAYATVGWTGMARLVRGQVIQLKEREYVLASRLLGAGAWRIILRGLIPNTLGIVIVNLTLTIPSAIFTEAFLSYIGLGVQIPLASLGTLASEGTASLQTYPELLFVPALFLCITMLTFNLLGDTLRDLIDPKYRE